MAPNSVSPAISSARTSAAFSSSSKPTIRLWPQSSVMRYFRTGSYSGSGFMTSSPKALMTSMSAS